jgi:hypothetical protein
MKVHVLFHETNSGSAAADSDGHVDAVYACAEAAEAARLDALRDARAKGLAIYRDPDDPDAEEDPYWTDDWRIEAHDVRGAP